jgi:uncharacterized membrane protein
LAASSPHPVRPDASPARAPRGGRIPALDAARALGVVAMVAGHTLDAVLSPAARAAPWAVEYWKARGLTAPLFLLVSGWAVSVAVQRAPARGLAIPRGRLGRAALLLAIGCALRWPGWGLDALRQGDRAVWAHLLGFDALHVIAVSLLAAAGILALPLRPRAHALAFVALVVLAVSLGMAAPAPLLPSVDELPAWLPALAVAQAIGGTSAFPLFPWSGYFFAGAVLGVATRGRGGARPALSAGLAGLALAAGATALAGPGVASLLAGDPLLFAFRTGVVLVVVAGLAAVPAAAAARVAPLGRASLAVYALHLPIVYGWSTQAGLAARIGPSLGAGAALGLALAVLAGCLLLAQAVALAWRTYRPSARATNSTARASAQ